jgi:hypothetical protein
MKQLIATLAAVTVLALPAYDAGAQSIGVKPGLWKMTTKVDMTGMPAMPNIDMSQISPERRAMVEAMLKRQNAGGQPHTTMSCVTPKDLESKEFYKNDDPNCTNTVTSHSSMGWSGKVVCTGKNPSHGDMQFNAPNPETINGVINMSTVDERGTSRQAKIDISGNWQSADCGTLKGK